MWSNREWMYTMRTTSKGFFNPEFQKYVNYFLDFAFANATNIQRQTIEGLETFLIRCPCSTCKNLRFKTRAEVQVHLYSKGFVDDYKVWYVHGESLHKQDMGQCSNSVPFRCVDQEADEDLGEYTGYDQMIMEGMHQNHHPYYHQGPQNPNQTAKTFYTMLNQANEPLWDGSKNASTLSTATSLLNWKSDCNVSDSAFDKLLPIIKNILPDDEKLARSFYETKKILKPLELPSLQIHGEVMRGGRAVSRGGHTIACEGRTCSTSSLAGTNDTRASMEGILHHEKIHQLPYNDDDGDYDHEDGDDDDIQLDQRESSFAEARSDTSRKPRITRFGTKFGNTTVHRSITRIFKEHFDKAWITFKQVPNDVVARVYTRFGTLWSWEPAAEERIYEGVINVLKARFRDYVRRLRVKSTIKARADGHEIADNDYTKFSIIREYPPDTVPLEMWRDLCTAWDTKEWLKRSASGTNNRASSDSNGITSCHTGGSIGFDEHRINMKKKLGKDPSFLQVFLDTHLTTESKAKLWAGKLDLHDSIQMDFCTERSKEAYEAYLSAMIEMYGPDFTQDNVDVWERVQAKDPTSRHTSHRVYGSGDSDINFVVTGAPSSSCGVTPSYVEYRQSQEKTDMLHVDYES
ncbi:hypothetical protein E3N88_14759 [Mikania micrantha]|uniref:Transposase-associated domain-containing protein n=1 Tax=Mikania micrantha TaxID=192012 RepID=A0A5N6P2E9_9ASTR|nr:hypothetical protein E3N88_14759 [Mikania micrantha]